MAITGRFRNNVYGAAAGLSLLFTLHASLVNAATPEGSERRTTLADQKSVAVTIYNENLALVKEVRAVELESGMNRLAVRDVSAMMCPETARLRALKQPDGLRVVKQNFKKWPGTGGIFNMSKDDHCALDKTAFEMVVVKNGDWEILK